MTPVVAPNLSGLCFCGCGGATRIAHYSNKKANILRGHPIRFIPGHQAITHGLSKTKQYHRDRALRVFYGLSAADFKAMADAQDNRCYICRQVRRLQVDHDHATGAVRKLLCNGCNSRLSMVEDPIILARAQAYLVEHS